LNVTNIPTSVVVVIVVHAERWSLRSDVLLTHGHVTAKSQES